MRGLALCLALSLWILPCEAKEFTFRKSRNFKPFDLAYLVQLKSGKVLKAKSVVWGPSKVRARTEKGDILIPRSQIAKVRKSWGRTLVGPVRVLRRSSLKKARARQSDLLYLASGQSSRPSDFYGNGRRVRH